MNFIVKLLDSQRSILYTGPSLELALEHARAWLLEPLGIAVVVECSSSL